MNVSPTGTVTPCRPRVSLRGKFWISYGAFIFGALLLAHWWFA